MMTNNLWFKIGLVILAIGGVLLARHMAIENSGTSDPRIGTQAPDFELSHATSNKTSALRDYQGEPVLLDFWSLTCPPCIEEMQTLRSIHRESKGEFNILSINIDAPSTRRDQRVKTMTEGKGIDFPVLLDHGPVARDYQIEIMPTLVLVDPQGHIARVFKGLTTAVELKKAYHSVQP